MKTITCFNLLFNKFLDFPSLLIFSDTDHEIKTILGDQGDFTRNLPTHNEN